MDDRNGCFRVLRAQVTFTVNKLRFHGGSNRTLVKWMNGGRCQLGFPCDAKRSTILIDEDGMPSSRNPS